MSGVEEGSLFGLGNPLLDITATVTDEFLAKYKLPKNEAILGNDKDEVMYEDLINSFEIDYTAGGATQNTMRFCQWIIGKNNANIASFLGCIGEDFFGKMMEKKAKGDGVKVLYSVDKDVPTGTCAVLVTDGGASRCAVAYLGAAERFTKEHLLKNWHWAEKARVYYVTGHVLSVSHDSVVALAHQTHKDPFKPKVFCFCLGAPYVCEKYGPQLMELVPYIDILFGNDAEALAFAKLRSYGTTDLKAIALKIANEPKNVGGRIAIITQGNKPVLVARNGDSNVTEYPVTQVEVVDTNGAGDAFTGGFLSQFIQEKPFDTCIKCAIYCASECVQRLGCQFPKENKFSP
ncbi:Adenosine kinase [Halotydeus destructor]|nr:Adenosine kinase [Halotydeus destructor]